jgi:tryptophan 2,3-dioxygenase
MIGHHDMPSKGPPSPLRDRMSYSDYLYLEESLAEQEPLSSDHDETLFILHLEDLLAAREPLSSGSSEMLFVIQQQSSDLWMKLAFNEIGAAIRALRADELEASLATLARAARIFEQLNNSWDVLRMMSPAEYPEFRKSLGQFAGFQSWQYRTVEFMAGHRDLGLRPHAGQPRLSARLQAILAEPSLYDEALLLLARNGFDVGADATRSDWSETRTESEEVLAAWAAIYRDRHHNWMFHELAEKLVDFEYSFRRWRFNHVTTLERIIGIELGDAGTSGVSYLKKRLEIELFPELWKVRARL